MKAGGTPRLAAPAWTQGVPPASRAMLATPPAITVHTSPSIAAQDIPGGVSASRALHLHASARGPELAWGAGGHSYSYGTQPEALTTLPTPPSPSRAPPAPSAGARPLSGAGPALADAAAPCLDTPLTAAASASPDLIGGGAAAAPSPPEGAHHGAPRAALIEHGAHPACVPSRLAPLRGSRASHRGDLPLHQAPRPPAATRALRPHTATAPTRSGATPLARPYARPTPRPPAPAPLGAARPPRRPRRRRSAASRPP